MGFGKECPPKAGEKCFPSEEKKEESVLRSPIKEASAAGVMAHFRKAVKIKKFREIGMVVKSGNRWSCRFCKIYYLSNALPFNRFAFIASKEAGSAVMRNRAKRILRELARTGMQEGEQHRDIVFRITKETAFVRREQIKSTLEPWFGKLKN